MPEWRNWQTRTTQNRVPSGVWVRFPPSAQKDYNMGSPYLYMEGFVIRSILIILIVQGKYYAIS